MEISNCEKEGFADNSVPDCDSKEKEEAKKEPEDDFNLVPSIPKSIPNISGRARSPPVISSTWVQPSLCQQGPMREPATIWCLALHRMFTYNITEGTL